MDAARATDAVRGGGAPRLCALRPVAFESGLGLFGPLDYFSLMRTVKKQVEEPSLDTILSPQRLGAGDYRVIVEFVSALARHARNLALCLHALEQNELALKLLERAIVLAPDDARFREWRDRIAARVGE